MVPDLRIDSSFDQKQLERQVAKCFSPGIYLLHLIDLEGYARVAIYGSDPTNPSLIERKPIHGVRSNDSRGSKDSYHGLIAILDGGFRSLFKRDFNATIVAEENLSYLKILASSGEGWGEISRRWPTSKDRYFLEFKRFSSKRWKNQDPTIFDGERRIIFIDKASVEDIFVNVILGTVDPVETQTRIDDYRKLFRQYPVEYHFLNADGLINAL